MKSRVYFFSPIGIGAGAADPAVTAGAATVAHPPHVGAAQVLQPESQLDDLVQASFARARILSKKLGFEQELVHPQEELGADWQVWQAGAGAAWHRGPELQLLLRELCRRARILSQKLGFEHELQELAQPVSQPPQGAATATGAAAGGVAAGVAGG